MRRLSHAPGNLLVLKTGSEPCILVAFGLATPLYCPISFAFGSLLVIEIKELLTFGCAKCSGSVLLRFFL